METHWQRMHSFPRTLQYPHWRDVVLSLAVVSPKAKYARLRPMCCSTSCARGLRICRTKRTRRQAQRVRTQTTPWLITYIHDGTHLLLRVKQPAEALSYAGCAPKRTTTSSSATCIAMRDAVAKCVCSHVLQAVRAGHRYARRLR